MKPADAEAVAHAITAALGIVEQRRGKKAQARWRGNLKEAVEIAVLKALSSAIDHGAVEYPEDLHLELVDPPLVPPGAPHRPPLKGVALLLWNETVRELLALGIIAKIDGGALANYCLNFARWAALLSAAAAEPLVMTRAGLRVNPAIAEARRVHKDCVQPSEIELGLRGG